MEERWEEHTYVNLYLYISMTRVAAPLLLFQRVWKLSLSVGPWDVCCPTEDPEMHSSCACSAKEQTVRMVQTYVVCL